jgi:hypothetical protein
MIKESINQRSANNIFRKGSTGQNADIEIYEPPLPK